MIKISRTTMRRRTTLAFPCIQTDVMVVTASGRERRLVSVALREFESEHIAIKRKCPIEVGDLQMDVSDADLRVNWL